MLRVQRAALLLHQAPLILGLCAGAAAVAQLDQEAPGNGSSTHFRLDTSDPASIDQLAAEVKAKYDQKVYEGDKVLATQKSLLITPVLRSQVKVVVNNAAVMSHNWADKDFALARATNYEGPVRLAEKLAPLMQSGWARFGVSMYAACEHSPGNYTCPQPAATARPAIASASGCTTPSLRLRPCC